MLLNKQHSSTSHNLHSAPVVSEKPKAASSSAAPTALPGSSNVAFTTMQSAVAKNMVESLSVPTFRVGHPVTTDALDALYEKVKPKGVTMTAILAKAAAMALVQHPVVNATCKDGKNFHYNSNINVAVAVAINGGLITPVLQDADKLDLYLLSQKWKELVAKARSKQLQPHEYNSGTFTLSNLGMFGVDRFDAILPPGQETPNTLPSSHFLPPPTLTEVIDETEIETETDAVLAVADTTETSPLSEFLATNDEYPSPEAQKSLLQQKLDLGEDEEALKILKHLMLSRLKLLKP
ncbi:hypothetical protein RYX36_000460 [Vicia faba]